MGYKLIKGTIKPVKPRWQEMKDYLKYCKIKKKDLVLDIGAYHGWFSELVSKKGAIVMAFEPDPINYKFLEKRLSKLKHLYFLYGFAVGEKEKEIGWDIQGMIAKPNQERKYKVMMFPLDSYHLKKIKLIKMDIEGYELEALKGMVETLKKTENIAIASYHIVNGQPTAKRVETFLKAHGFKVKTELNSEDCLITYGKTTLG